MIPVFVGFDPREAVAYTTFVQSLIQHSSKPLQITPLALHSLPDYTETHSDGSNAFIYSRFLIPHMMGYRGHALFFDGDMLMRDDVAKLWAMRDDHFAVQVVKHDYKTKQRIKYVGTSMQTHNADYPRKNWSSVMLLNCGHPANRLLTPDYVMNSTGAKLHRFEHLSDDEIGDLPAEWNWLAGEYPFNNDAKCVHYTLGIPAIRHYWDSDHAEEWREALKAANHVEE